MLFYQRLKSVKLPVTLSALLVGLLLLVAVPARALDSNYNSNDAYGSCSYGQTCASSPAASGGSSSSASADTAGSQIILNDFAEYTSDSGKTLDVSLNQIISFYTTNRDASNLHTATLSEIGADYVVITFGPTAQTVRLSINQTGQYDVNNDGQDDIGITLNSVTDGQTANLTFKALSPAPAPTPTKTVTTAATATPAKKSHLGLILSIIAIVIAIGIYLWLLIAKRRRKNNTPSW